MQYITLKSVNNVYVNDFLNLAPIGNMRFSKKYNHIKKYNLFYEVNIIEPLKSDPPKSEEI